MDFKEVQKQLIYLAYAWPLAELADVTTIQLRHLRAAYVCCTQTIHRLHSYIRTLMPRWCRRPNKKNIAGIEQQTVRYLC